MNCRIRLDLGTSLAFLFPTLKNRCEHRRTETVRKCQRPSFVLFFFFFYFFIETELEPRNLLLTICLVFLVVYTPDFFFSYSSLLWFTSKNSTHVSLVGFSSLVERSWNSRLCFISPVSPAALGGTFHSRLLAANLSHWIPCYSTCSQWKAIYFVLWAVPFSGKRRFIIVGGFTDVKGSSLWKETTSLERRAPSAVSRC